MQRLAKPFLGFAIGLVGHGSAATGFSTTQAMVRGVLLILLVNLTIDLFWVTWGA